MEARKDAGQIIVDASLDLAIVDQLCTCVGCTNLPVAQPKHQGDPDNLTDHDNSTSDEDIIVTGDVIFDPTVV